MLGDPYSTWIIPSIHVYFAGRDVLSTQFLWRCVDVPVEVVVVVVLNCCCIENIPSSHVYFAGRDVLSVQSLYIVQVLVVLSLAYFLQVCRLVLAPAGAAQVVSSLLLPESSLVRPESSLVRWFLAFMVHLPVLMLPLRRGGVVPSFLVQSSSLTVRAIGWSIGSLLERARTPLPCLLYTSPSPRDRQKSRMPSSA